MVLFKRLKRVLKKGVYACLALIAFYGVGFACFLSFLPVKDDFSFDVHQTDALVIFTGGSKRIESAIDLLKHGYDKPILISGVNPLVSRDYLLHGLTLSQQSQVTVDYISLSTQDNAKMTKEWAERNKVKRIGLITSYYHVPRSLIYLNDAGFDGGVQTLPVFPENMPLGFLLREYNKYLWTLALFV